PKPTEEYVPRRLPPDGQSDLFLEGKPKLPGDGPPPAKRKPAAPAAEPDERPPRKLLSTVIDVAVGLVLLVAGVLAAEVLLRKPTRQVIEEASGPRFPSIDLVVWAGLPVALVLIYVMLAGRGLSIGGWLRKRS